MIDLRSDTVTKPTGQVREAMAILMYDEARKSDSPRETILEFLESAYQAGAKRADWDIEKFKLKTLK